MNGKPLICFFTGHNRNRPACSSCYSLGRHDATPMPARRARTHATRCRSCNALPLRHATAKHQSRARQARHPDLTLFQGRVRASVLIVLSRRRLPSNILYMLKAYRCTRHRSSNLNWQRAPPALAPHVWTTLRNLHPHPPLALSRQPDCQHHQSLVLVSSRCCHSRRRLPPPPHHPRARRPSPALAAAQGAAAAAA